VTPDETRFEFSKNDDESYVDPTKYRRLVSSLRYMCKQGLILHVMLAM